MRLLAPFLCLLSFVAGVSAAEYGTPPFKLWNEVKSPPLRDFKPPAAERFVLPNGMIVFLLEDHELPLIEMTMLLRAGELYEPPQLTGVANATAAVLRSGGSAQYPGDKLDAILENMAAEISLSIGLDSGSANLKTLKEDFGQGLGIFADVLRHPAFPQDKLDLYLAQQRTAIAKRNDTAGSISGREFRKALFGVKSPYAKVVEYENLERIDRQALLAFHRKYFHPNSFIAGVAGDFKKDEMLAKLKAAFGDWPAEKVEFPAVEKLDTAHPRKTLFVERPQLNQTTITLGHMLDMRRDDPDYPALQVLNYVLSGSMSARLFTEIRTKRGLAYTVRAFSAVPYDHPGEFQCAALTRNEQAVETLAALRGELERLRDKGATEQEVAEARESIANSFVFNFDTPAKIVSQQLTYEFYGYPLDFTEKLLRAVQQVTVAEVNRAAQKYLDPANLITLGVGSTAGLEPAQSFAALPGVQMLDVTIPGRQGANSR